MSTSLVPLAPSDETEVPSYKSKTLKEGQRITNKQMSAHMLSTVADAYPMPKTAQRRVMHYMMSTATTIGGVEAEVDAAVAAQSKRIAAKRKAAKKPAKKLAKKPAKKLKQIPAKLVISKRRR